MDTPNTLLLMLGFFGFLLVNLLLGLYKGRNVNTMKDYALANRAMGTGTLMMTIIATMVGGIYVTTGFIASQSAGLIDHLIFLGSFTVAGLFLGRVVFPRLLRFKNCYTLGDIMGQHYGPKAQLATGMVSTVVCLMVIAAQLLALENIATMLGMQGYTIIIMAIVGGAIVVYTLAGGMRAVAATDVLQFALVMGGFAFIAYQIFGLKVTVGGETTKVDSVGDFFEKVHSKVSELGSQHLALWNHDERNRYILGALRFTTVFFSPAIINRVLAARNRPQVRQAFTGFVFFYTVLTFLLIFIGFGVLLSYGYDPDNPISEHDVFKVVQEYLFQKRMASIAVQCLLMVMLLGVIMSTADSYLNALVVVVIRDIIQYKQKNKAPDTAQLMHVKKIAIAAGLVSIGLAYLFAFFKAYSTTLADLSNDVLGCFAILLIAAAFRLKGNTKTFFYTVAVFLGLFALTFMLFHTNILMLESEKDWKKLLPRHKIMYAVVPILVLTAIFFLGIHKKVYGRFTWEKPKVKKEVVRPLGGVKAKWRTIFTNPLVWAKDTFARYGNEPAAVGFFLALSSVARVTISPRFAEAHTMIFTGLNILGTLLCGFLMVHMMLRQPLKNYFPLFYYGTLIYVLPFIHMLLFLYQPMSVILLVQLVIAIILLHLLVDWRTYCLFTLIGWGLAGVVYWLTAVKHAQPTDLAQLGEMVWRALVCIASALGVGFLFGSRQEQINTQRLKRTKTYAAAFGHDLLNLYQCPQSTIDYVQQAYKQGKKEQIDEAKAWHDMQRYMVECIVQARAFKKLVKHDYIPQKEMEVVSIKALMQKAYDLIPSISRPGVEIKTSKDFTVEVFPPFVNNIILNLVKNAQKHGNAKEVTISWDAETRRLYIADNGSGIPSYIAAKIGDLYTTSTQDGSGNGIGLAFVFMVVEDIFKGQIDFTTSDTGTTFWIEFPPIKGEK